jgi:hypothetical protein
VEFVVLFGAFVALTIIAGILVAALGKGSRTKRIMSGVASAFTTGLVLYLVFPIVGQWILRQMAGSGG